MASIITSDKDEKIAQGARAVINRWIRVRKGMSLCIVTSPLHLKECEYLKEEASKAGGIPTILLVEQEDIHVGEYFDENPDIFLPYDVIIGASDYSIITTKAADVALSAGKKVLSLPLSTSTSRSMLSFDFMFMDPAEARITAETAIGMIGKADTVHITTRSGTDLTMSIKDRPVSYFNGNFWPRHPFSSASFEIYCPIVETETEGTLICDGSFGYIGKVREPVRIEWKEGRIVSIEDSEEGRRLKTYFEQYHDTQMYVAGELGIGLNELSRCVGECYIEDESTYGTFHIGVGRNIGLGGKHEASGHFDLVTWHPTIWFDDKLIMKDGSFVMPD